MGAYSRRVLIQGWALIIVTFLSSEDIFLENNKRKDNTFISLQPNKTKCKTEQFGQSINSSLTV